ncbi:helix-turn-helix domain-containing protein [Streptomyces sp. NPDC048643]|uniref:helix-turn-helix domain-containing protein n=1 Tax=Streptomyces sp. NPDC048643 TaxID=3155637 RepID=UPI003418F8ED
MRMLAAEGLARGEKNTAVAKDLRVSVRSVERWRRSWREGGFQALKASGPAKRPKVDDRDFALREPLLLAGAVAQGRSATASTSVTRPHPRPHHCGRHSDRPPAFDRDLPPAKRRGMLPQPAVPDGFDVQEDRLRPGVGLSSGGS